MQSSLRIGRVFGIPIEIHGSWLFVFGLIVWSLAADYFPMHHPGLDGATSWLAAVATALLFFGSVVVHELAHSLVARARGIPVERITLFALGGASELKRETSRPRTELVVALVGPLTSLALAAVLWLIWRAVVRVDMTLGAIAFYLAYGNLALGVFNLIPGFPLDGGRVLRAALWALWNDFERATLGAVRAGRAAAAGLVVAGIWQVVVAQGANGVWLILVGWFLWSAAEQEGTRTLIELRLRGRSIVPLVRFDFITLDAEQTITEAAVAILGAPPQAVYPVLARGSFVGVLSAADLNTARRELWAATKLNWLVRRARPVPTIDLKTDVLDALAQIDALRLEGLPVRDEGEGVVALLERGAIVRWVELSMSARS